MSLKSPNIQRRINSVKPSVTGKGYMHCFKPEPENNLHTNKKKQFVAENNTNYISVHQSVLTNLVVNYKLFVHPLEIALKFS